MLLKGHNLPLEIKLSLFSHLALAEARNSQHSNNNLSASLVSENEPNAFFTCFASQEPYELNTIVIATLWDHENWGTQRLTTPQVYGSRVKCGTQTLLTPEAWLLTTKLHWTSSSTLRNFSTRSVLHNILPFFSEVSLCISCPKFNLLLPRSTYTDVYALTNMKYISTVSFVTGLGISYAQFHFWLGL